MSGTILSLETATVGHDTPFADAVRGIVCVIKVRQSKKMATFMADNSNFGNRGVAFNSIKFRLCMVVRDGHPIIGYR